MIFSLKLGAFKRYWRAILRTTMSEEQDKFSVIRARDEDINKKIVRMSDDDIQESGLISGNVVMLRSTSGKTVGILSVGDVGSGVISVPAMMRMTMGIKENDQVTVTAISKQSVKVMPRISIEI